MNFHNFSDIFWIFKSKLYIFFSEFFFFTLKKTYFDSDWGGLFLQRRRKLLDSDWPKAVSCRSSCPEFFFTNSSLLAIPIFLIGFLFKKVCEKLFYTFCLSVLAFTLKRMVIPKFQNIPGIVSKKTSKELLLLFQLSFFLESVLFFVGDIIHF